MISEFLLIWFSETMILSLPTAQVWHRSDVRRARNKRDKRNGRLPRPNVHVAVAVTSQLKSTWTDRIHDNTRAFTVQYYGDSPMNRRGEEESVWASEKAFMDIAVVFADCPHRPHSHAWILLTSLIHTQWQYSDIHVNKHTSTQRHSLRSLWSQKNTAAPKDWPVWVITAKHIHALHSNILRWFLSYTNALSIPPSLNSGYLKL